MSDEQLRTDELVSAYLDGEATPAEIAEVERDGALMARVEQLRAVRDAVATPVAPASSERRDQMISAALAVADTEADLRHQDKVVLIHRRRPTLLAIAAAVMLLAAVVSAGLIASRGGDDDAEMASATAAADAPTAEAAPAEADMAMVDDSAGYGMAAEPMAEEEPMATTTTAYVEMAEEEPTADEAAVEIEAAAAEAESGLEAPADGASEPAVSADAAETDQDTEEERRSADDASSPVVDLGTSEDLESLLEDFAARWSAALDDGAMSDPGACSDAVHEQALALAGETVHSFIVTIGVDDSLAFDGRFARRADGTAVIVYAAPPRCEVGIHEAGEPDGS